MDNNTITQSKKKSLVPTSKSVVEAIQKQEAGFAMVLPPDFDSARFTRIAITAIKTNPKLAQCSRESLLGSLMLSAQFGLEPNSPLHEAVLIPYGNKVEFQVEYRGLLKLAWNSGMIQSIDYNKICENDEYTYSLGFEPVFTHKPELMKERGETIAYYAIAALKDGGRAMVLMSKSEIYDHGKRFSRSFRLKDSPWQTDFDSMAIKTCIRQLVDKKLPKATTKEALLFRSVASADMSIPTVKDIKKDVKLSMDDIEITPGFEEIKPEKPKRAKAKATPTKDEKTPPTPKETPKNTNIDPEVHQHPLGAGFAQKDSKNNSFTDMVSDLSKKLLECGEEPDRVIEDVAGTPLISENWSDEVKAEIIDKLSLMYDKVITAK